MVLKFLSKMKLDMIQNAWKFNFGDDSTWLTASTILSENLLTTPILSGGLFKMSWKTLHCRAWWFFLIGRADILAES